MSDPDPATELSSLIESQKGVLNELAAFLASFLRDDLVSWGRDRKSGLVVAGTVENYYTCAETVLFRISQEFGNTLEAGRWHADLLTKLSLDVPAVRPRLLGDYTFERLDELRRFRHFKSYYFRIDFDWDRLDFLVKKLQELHPVLLGELTAFQSFLERLNRD